MFGTLGGPELLLILVIALIVFGPRRLPDIGKSVGKMMAEFRRASNDFKRTIEEEVEADKMRAALDAPRIDFEGAEPPASTEPTAVAEQAAAPEAPGDAAPDAAPAETPPEPVPTGETK